jgi:poly-gamma-glutamate biosynthesis protein PgsC/CapC
MIENLFIGLLISCLFIEFTGVYPGGIIVPAYVAMYLDQPYRIAGTLIVSLVCFGSYKVLSRHILLFGRRRFVFLLLLGGFWLFVWNTIAINDVFWGCRGLYGIGVVIPGIIANTYERQGIGFTIVALIIAAAMTYFVVKLVGALI